MNKQILQNESIETRLDSLRATAVKTEKFTYSRELDLGEVQELQNEISQSMILIDN